MTPKVLFSAIIYFINLKINISGIPIPLQPRPATTGCDDIQPLHPRYLPTFELEFQSDSRDLQKKLDQPTYNSETSLMYTTDPSYRPEMERETLSVPVKAIESSTDVLVGIVESHTKISTLFSSTINVKPLLEEKNSPDFDNVKSPSTEFTTSTLESTPVEETKIDGTKNKDTNQNDTVCDTVGGRESKRYFV